MINPEIAVAGFVGLAASVEDILRRRISNWIPIAAVIGGLLCQVLAYGWMGALYALGGTVSGFSVFLIFYWLGGMGGGDVKLMAGFGALLGAGRLIEAAVWAAAVGGILAAAVVLWGLLRSRFRRSSAGPAQASDSIPYAPAIVLGAWLALVPK